MSPTQLKTETDTERELLAHAKRLGESLTAVLQNVPKSAYGLLSTFKEMQNPVLYVNEQCIVLWANDQMLKLLSSCRGTPHDLSTLVGAHLCEVVKGLPCRLIDTPPTERTCPVMATIAAREITINKDGALPAGCENVSEICYLPVYNGYSGCFIIYRYDKANT